MLHKLGWCSRTDCSWTWSRSTRVAFELKFSQKKHHGFCYSGNHDLCFVDENSTVCKCRRCFQKKMCLNILVCTSVTQNTSKIARAKSELNLSSCSEPLLQSEMGWNFFTHLYTVEYIHLMLLDYKVH